MKAAALVPAMRAVGIEVTVIHTGQHSDPAMSQKLCDELDLKIDIQLDDQASLREVMLHHERSNAERLGDMIVDLSREFCELRFDLVMVVGDCDSTLAGALAAKKCGLRLAHVEAGLRADDVVQENLNRILVDEMSDDLFISEPTADAYFEEVRVWKWQKVHSVGNVMIDTLRRFKGQALVRQLPYDIGKENGLDGHDYAVLTLHRAENVDENMRAALACAEVVAKRMKVVFPIHPRTALRMRAAGFTTQWENFINLPPLGYLDFVNLIARAKLVMTDSGGVQEETTVLGVPCLTLRAQTERPATISDGTNELVGFDAEKVRAALEKILRGEWKTGRGPSLWDGHAAERIANILIRKLEAVNVA